MKQRSTRNAIGMLSATLWALVAGAPALAAVGRTPASFDVSASGEAMYAIPIAVPPGVRGVTPQLALVYAHRSGQSIAGYGWGISGALVISRCASTAIQDTIPRNVRNDYSDRFCLNGNKLRLVGTTGYGLSGSEYRTEIETYSRIKAYGAVGNGPTHFIVEGKDGFIYEFGNTGNSRIESQGQSTARAWALNKIRDRDANEINFTYFEDSANGSYRLDSVGYAGNSAQGTLAIYSIDLVYEPRPAEEIDSAYLAGSVIKETQRLSRIDVLHNGSTLFRRYDLTYEPSLSATMRSRLTSVQECAGSGADCLVATQFTYQDGAPLGPEMNTGYVVNPSATVFPIDVNGDGRDDLVYPNGTGPWMVMFADSSGGYNPPIDTTKASTGSSGAIPIDHNSDGKMDLLVPYSGGTWWVLTISGSGAGTITDTGAPATATGSDARAMDIDGDGRQDLVWIEIGANWAGNDAIRYRKRLASGAGFDATATPLVDVNPDEKLFGGIFGEWAQKTPRRTADFNGDGIGDIVYSRRIRIDEGEPGIPPFEYQYLHVLCPGASTCLSAQTEVAGAFYHGDLNGDGLSDLIYLDQSATYRYHFSTGTGFTAAGSTGFGASYGSIVIFDWDSDGYDDVLAKHPTTSTWQVARSNGEVLLAPVDAGFGSGSGSGTSAHVVTDMNGDRQPDFAYRGGAGNTWRFRAHSTTFEYPDVLETATDGFGVTATFAHRPITQSSVYTKGTGAAFPMIDSQRPLWVVSTLTATDGTGNSTTYTLNYTYEAARQHLTGRGFLGFAKRNVVDSRLGYNIKTIGTYKQDFPYIGALASREQLRSNGKRISLASNTWDNLTWGTAGSTERRFPYVRTRSLEEHELDTPGTKFRTVSTAVAATGGIDTTSGLILDATTTTTDVAGGWTRTERALNTLPFNDTTNWCIGRPNDTAITKSHTLPNGGSLTRNFDTAWDGLKCRPTQQRLEPDNATWRVTADFLYDAFGNVNSEAITGAGMSARTTLTNWGTRGQFPQSVSNPLSQTTTQTWNDVYGQPASVTDPNGIATSWSYDVYGRRTLETRADGTKTSWSYNLCPSGCDARVRYYVQQEQKDTANAVFRTTIQYFNRWDALGWEQGSLLGSDAAWTAIRDFDARGRVIKQFVPYLTTQADLGSRRWTYDQVDRVVTDRLYTSGGSIERSTGYAYSGLSSIVTDPLTHPTTRVMSAWGDLIAVTDAMTGTMSHEYNAFGELKQTKDAANNIVATVTYNLRGYRTQLADMNLGIWNYTPNALGEVVSQTDAKPQTTTFTYDKLGRLLTRDEPGTATDATWTWGTSAALDEIGRLKSVAAPGYSESFLYDTAGRSKTRTIVSDATYVYDFAYNSIGELYTLTYPVSTSGVRFKLKHLYNNGHLEAIRQFTGDVDNTTYWSLNAMNARGQASDEAYGNGLWLQSTYQALTGQIATRQSGTGGSTNNLQDLAYTWDTADNLSQRRDLRQSTIESFTYDSLDRLTQSSGPGGTQTIGYNAIGNITSRSDVASGAAWTYHASKKHAVTAAGGVSYGYDANGNMTSRAGATLTWTSANQPAMLNGNGYTAQFDYAPDRSRWRQVSSYADGTETTVYIGGLMEKLTTSTSTAYKHLIPTPSGFVQHVRKTGGSTATYYMAADHLGSVDAVLNSAGNVMVRPSFAATGARRDDDWNGLPSASELDQIEITSRRGFTSHEMLDNVGLVHMNGRVYDPAIGRFVSADPFIDGETNPQGWNRYAYVKNRPCSTTDSTGFTDDGRALINSINGQMGSVPVAITVTASRISFGGFGFSLGGTPGFAGSAGGSEGAAGANRGDSGREAANEEQQDDQSEDRKLDDCEKTALSPYIPQEDLNNATLHDGRVPWYLADRYIGITRGNDIYFRPGVYDPSTSSGLGLLGHELVHVGQYRQGATWFSFVSSYARYGYENSPFEVSAREIEEQIRRGLESSGQTCGGGS